MISSAKPQNTQRKLLRYLKKQRSGMSLRFGSKGGNVRKKFETARRACDYAHSSLYCVIIQVRVVLKRTVVGD